MTARLPDLLAMVNLLEFRETRSLVAQSAIQTTAHDPLWKTIGVRRYWGGLSPQEGGDSRDPCPFRRTSEPYGGFPGPMVTAKLLMPMTRGCH